MKEPILPKNKLSINCFTQKRSMQPSKWQSLTCLAYSINGSTYGKSWIRRRRRGGGKKNSSGHRQMNKMSKRGREMRRKRSFAAAGKEGISIFAKFLIINCLLFYSHSFIDVFCLLTYAKSLVFFSHSFAFFYICA